MKARETPSDPIHPIRLAALIQKVVGDDAYYVTDGGDTVYFGLVHFRSKLRAGVVGPRQASSGASAPAFPSPWQRSLPTPTRR